MRKLFYILIASFLLFGYMLIGAGTPGTVRAAAGPVSLSFDPHDIAVDPSRPIVYMTDIGSNIIYAANYDTGAIKQLTLPYPAERLELYNGRLYVTQHKMEHDSYNFGPYEGAIAEINLQTFTLHSSIDVTTDPYDIAIDKGGYLYISPGSGQWESLMVISLQTKKVVKSSPAYNSIRERSNLYYSAATNKVYSIDTDTSPRDVSVFTAANGVLTGTYDSPYHGDYELEPFAKISPDGLSMYNLSGTVFSLSKQQSADLHLQLEMDVPYNDYAFSTADQLTFAAGQHGGIDIYKYKTKEYVYSLKHDVLVKKLAFKNGLIAVYENLQGKHYLEFISNYKAGPISLMGAASVYADENDEVVLEEFFDGAKNVHTDSNFILAFDQVISLKDETKITLQGPNGAVHAEAEVYEDSLFITPSALLKTDTAYTLTIAAGAIAGYDGKGLPKEITLRFTTARPPAPTVHAIWDSHTAITGTALPNTKAIARAGSKTIGTARVGADGKYSITIAKQPAGTSVSVYIQDGDSKRSDVTVITVIDKTPPPAPSVNTVTTSSTRVTGRTEPNATVSIYNSTARIGSAKADANGVYKISIPSQKRGTVLKVRATDTAKNISPVTKATVQ